MASDNNRRVELRLSLTQGRLRGTPEHIESLRLRQQEADRLAGAGAPGAFDKLMASGSPAGPKPAAATADGAKLPPSPRPGRRPGGPRVRAEQDPFGRDDDGDAGDDDLGRGDYLVRG